MSIEANRLRRALERYYLKAGKNDPVRIDIPKGTYVPTFTEQISAEPDTISGTAVSEKNIESSWPSVLIMPLKNLTGDPGKDFLGIGISTELAIEISRFQEIKVLFPLEGQIKATPPAGESRFVLNGTVFQDTSGIKITVYMTDAKTGAQIWGDTHRANFDVNEFIAFQEEVAQTIATKTAGEFGVIPKIMASESRSKPPSELNTYEAILRFYEYQQSYTPEYFRRAMKALEQAAVNEPDCGHLWSMLAHLYANIYVFDLPGYANPLEKAIEYAEKGASINPNNQRTVAVLAYIRFCCNELTSALKEVDRALELNPNSTFMLDGLAYIMTLSGAWERGTALIKQSMKVNPYYRREVHYALWVNCLRQEDYDGAYLETMSLKNPDFFWLPLAKAVALGLLERTEEGKNFIKKLLKLKPDFPDKGRVLIGHYIKFEKIADLVSEGLKNLGMTI